MKLRYSNIVVIILGGGLGSRLYPLTASRAKPAVPFGASFRLVSGPISNCINSGLRKIFVVTQYEPAPLERTLRGYAAIAAAPLVGDFLSVLSPRMRGVEGMFFRTEAHSITLLRRVFEQSEPDFVIVTMADQLMAIDLCALIEMMSDAGALSAMVYTPVSIDEARGKLGVLTVDHNGMVSRIDEKPDNPVAAQGEQGRCHANLALYAFESKRFFEMLNHIEQQHDPSVTLSRSGIPYIIERGAIGFNLEQNPVPGAGIAEHGFFEDMGDPKTYFETSMHMCQTSPRFNIFNQHWRLHPDPSQSVGPSKIDASHIDQVLFGGDVIVQRGVKLDQTIVSGRQIVCEGTRLRETVLLGEGTVGAGCDITRTVIDKRVVVPPGTVLSPEHLPKRTLTYDEAQHMLTQGIFEPIPPVVADGILYIPRGYQFA